MRDVAALAGVSIKTVSRVVNGSPEVSAELRQRVSQASAQLEFHPNLAASSLRRRDGKTRQVALLIEDVANPFSATLHRAIEDVANTHDTLVFAGSLDEDPQRELELVRAAVQHRMDGIIIVPASSDHGYLHREMHTGTPVVFVDRPPRGLVADAVLSDNTGGAYRATAHLAAYGHRDIAFLGDDWSIRTVVERYEGYERALADQGLPRREEIVACDLSDAAAAARATQGLMRLPNPPTALFTSQNLVTMGAIETLQAMGLHHRVAVVGFDDFPAADLLDPRVTVVAQDVFGIGTLAIRRLFSRIAGDASPVWEERLETRLIVRGSGELPPSDGLIR
ncbi:LacI family DNA-binding transcriptional regulator [Nocardiopsis suaedae]|uniref:LacI family DNA-binding transcriptional regulator n=1 Tax=Nocardiopsis suaedae TaxID=3018444 RepID=A0ABT4TLD6_9ACTN|nr:LacI family DNA-binding transcriptional regulator [Nocardiopsis suaedae]MDA2805518.1 LacI family DNA-binding transcriptional regulator [Nocardiopsis suaedae]